MFSLINAASNCNLRIFYQNVRGLRTKTKTILINVLKQDLDVILLTETWLNDSVFDHELFDSRYIVFRRDRSSTNCSKLEGGGVLVAVLKTHSPIRKLKWESELEDLWVSFKFRQGNSVVELCICTVYLSPPIVYSKLDTLLSNVTDVVQHKIPKKAVFLMAGDFNLPNIKWEYDVNSKSMTPRYSSNQTDNLLTDSLSFNSLYQINSVLNTNGRLLDLIITNSCNTLSVSNSTTPLVSIDNHHPALEILVKVNALKPPKVHKSLTLNFPKANYVEIKKSLDQIDWNDHFTTNLSVDETVDVFYDIITPIITNNTPIRRKGQNCFPFWFSRPLIQVIKEKAKFHRRFKMYENPRDRLTYQILRERCDNMLADCLNKFKSNAKIQMKNNPKYFWTFVKSLRSNSSDIPDEMFLGNQNVQGGQNISNLFSDYFHSTYHDNPTASSFPTDPTSNFTTLSSCYLSESDILYSIKLLDNNKGPGPDSIPPLFLKSCSSQLAKPLQIIFNKSLSNGFFPTKWKLAHITPIHKKGDLGDISNYRPISILSSMGKLFESIIQKRILFHLKSQFIPQQHGFLPKRSTASNLVDFVSDITEAFENKHEVHAIYTDFSKAFDVVNHELLVEKLGHAGICGSLLRWCESYLRNRSQLVMVRGFKSPSRIVPSGVPQGSHLGPLFFLVYVNDLCTNITSKFQMFADDLKLYREIHSNDDKMCLQRDINTINDWCDRNKMVLNSSKCFYLNFSRKRNSSHASYFIKNDQVSEISSMRDLGVVVDTKLDFKEHLDSLVKKSARLAGFVIRQTNFFKDPEVAIVLFNCYVRSLMEYCSPVWCPSYAVHINRLERVQKQFLYHLSYSHKLCRRLRSYSSRLAHFKMSPLELRRNVADMVFLQKLVNGHIDAPKLLEKIDFAVPRSSSRLHNRITFTLPHRQTSYGQHSPLYRMCSSYNEICHNIDIFSAPVSSFKRLLLS